MVALSEALTPAIIIHESCRDIGLEVGPSPDVLFVVKTDSQVTLTQLRDESVTTRSRPLANKFSYARDMCYGTSIHPASVRARKEPKGRWAHKSAFRCIVEVFCVRFRSGTAHSLVCDIVSQTTVRWRMCREDSPTEVVQTAAL